jgi:hypothetical protein
MDVVCGNKMLRDFLNYSKQQRCQDVKVDKISQANFPDLRSTKQTVYFFFTKKK